MFETHDALVIVGLGYGDEVKGGMVDWAVREFDADVVVRFNGGAQAGHNVVLEDGTHHESHQFGAGTLAGIDTYLSRYCLVHPEVLLEEAAELRGKLGRSVLDWMYVDADAAVTTPFHVETNRIREVARGRGRHGSTGMGIWETEKDRRQGLVVTMRDVRDLDAVALGAKLLEVHERKLEELVAEFGRWYRFTDTPALLNRAAFAVIRDEYKVFAEHVTITDGFPTWKTRPVFEGAQGILLDEKVGFHPYTTGSTTTAANALAVCADAGFERVHTIGVTRSYGTRHGAGPFPTETDALDFPEPHNPPHKWQKTFRQGWLDTMTLRYAIACEPRIDAIAVTHMDRLAERDDWQIGVGYEDWDGDIPVPTSRPEQIKVAEAVAGAMPMLESRPDVLGWIAAATGRPVRYLSSGPTAATKAHVGDSLGACHRSRSGTRASVAVSR
jgi:adenylosuccinate synthase